MACQLCDRPCPNLTLHHLVPRQYARRKKLDAGPTIVICAPCHKQIHTLFSNKHLAQELNALEKLRSTPELQTFLAWIQKQAPDKKVRSFRKRG